MSRGAVFFGVTVFAAPLVVSACSLDEVSVVAVEPSVIAEVFVNVSLDQNVTEIVGFVHRTLGSRGSGDVDLGRTRIVVSASRNRAVTLPPAPIGRCVAPTDGGRLRTAESGVPAGACFATSLLGFVDLLPGDSVMLTVELADGRRLEGVTRIPVAFSLTSPTTCSVPAETLLGLEWTRSAGAWAYVNETTIRGLEEALAPEGIEVEEDPLFLLGLSISEADTTVVFPAEFGLFERFDLDRDLAVRLQRGLPPGTEATISVTAVDRSFVNWARGGDFNPSGQVRVSSLVGDGSGVFSATARRTLSVRVDDPLLPLCASVGG